MAEQTTKTYIPRISYKGKELLYQEVTLNVTTESIYKCEYCDDEIKYDQIKDVVPTAEKKFVEDLLFFINNYRNDYKLDTCLRKAHFIAQVGAEMGFMKKNLKEDHNYNYENLIKNYFAKSQQINSTIISSLKLYLIDIFKITNASNDIVNKTNSELETILTTETPTVDVRKLYGKYKGGDEVIKVVKKTEKNSQGIEVEVVDYTIILKNHNAFRKPLFSRFYASRVGNGIEASREGFMYCGKGLKQLTGKTNYLNFTDFRDKNPFPSDNTGKIDFTKVLDSNNHEGNFDKLADESNLIYAVQSALWYYQRGNPYKTKYTVDYADLDDIEWTSRTLNGGNNGKKLRRDYTFNARNIFKVYEHYKLAHENGNNSEKKKIEEQILSISISNKVSNTGTAKIDLKDPEAEKLLKELRKVEALKIELMPIKTIELKIDTPELKLIPFAPKN